MMLVMIITMIIVMMIMMIERMKSLAMMKNDGIDDDEG